MPSVHSKPARKLYDLSGCAIVKSLMASSRVEASTLRRTKIKMVKSRSCNSTGSHTLFCCRFLQQPLICTASRPLKIKVTTPRPQLYQCLHCRCHALGPQSFEQ